MGTKKNLLVLALAMAMVMMMSACAMAGPMGGNTWTNIDVDKTVFMSDYDSWSSQWTDQSQDNDLIDLDKSCLEVDVDADCLNAASNQGNIVNDSKGVLIVGISDIDISLANTTSYSYNVGSFNSTIIGSANTTYINSGNDFISTVNVTNQSFCGNTVNATLTNIANDYSKTDVDITKCEYDLKVKDCCNTVGSFNDIGCDNTVVDNDFFNYASFNTDCDGNGNFIDLDL